MNNSMENGKEEKTSVRERYEHIARTGGTCGCGSSSLSGSYDEVEGHVPEADLDLGCGLPTEGADVEPGDVVLDLGSGAGNDAFVARRIVGEAGYVLGIDFSEGMINKSRANAEKLGYTNVEFRSGDVEDLPVGDASVDVVLSNCVLNLVPDKARAFSEIYRVLKPGGHFSISDIVSRGAMSNDLRQAAESHTGCVAGAMDRDEYLRTIRAAGFQDVRVQEERSVMPPVPDLQEIEPTITDVPESVDILSITIRAARL